MPLFGARLLPDGGNVRTAIGKATTFRWLAPAIGALLALAGCADDAESGGFSLPAADVVIDAAAAKDAKANDQLANSDSNTVAQDAADTAPPQDAASDGSADAVAGNTPPQFQPLPAVTLKQGTSTTLDLNPLLYDAEDPKSQLKLSWSGKQVALKDPGTHQLLVVAPTTWFGTETLAILLKDQGGLTATQDLKVTVEEVKADPPQRTKDCGTTTFSIAAGKSAKQVLLSGTFNGWADKADKADVLTDPTSSGTWSVKKQLAAGVYQYKFIVDGKWMADQNNPNQTPDGMGGSNSVIEVSPCTP